MKKSKFALAVAMFCMCVFAQAVNVVTGGQAPFSLYTGAGTGKALSSYPTFVACQAAAADLKVGKYTCMSKSALVVTAPATSNMPVIDVSKIPAAGAAFDTARVQPVDLTNPQNVPPVSDIGAFRTSCTFSHMSFDDPIVFPGQSGASHLHTFFGNSLTSATSTVASIAASGGSTCAGGTLNRTAYWVPALIDTATHIPLVPTLALIYYKTGYEGVNPADVKALPTGLRFISGSAKATTPGGPMHFACLGQSADQSWQDHIPSCLAGDELIVGLDFPQCWDGVNLDSPDHASHVVGASHERTPPGCPADHPVALPQISYLIHYAVPSTGSASWRLSSDNYPATMPGGYSGHGDYMMGWDAKTMQTFITNCDNTSKDCHGYLLGDGTILY